MAMTVNLSFEELSYIYVAELLRNIACFKSVCKAGLVMVEMEQMRL